MLWLWNGPLPEVPPQGRRMVIGQGTWVRQNSVAAWLTIWLKPTVEKSANCISMIGRMPFDRGADGQAHHGIFADRRVDHAPGKFLRQVLGGLERAAERAHVLAVDEHARVVRQRARLGFADGFQVGDAHRDADPVR